jgi:hypothetical protein
MSASALQRCKDGCDRTGSPHGGPHALSWGYAALRGHRPDRPRADMGSARPVRRSFALRALIDRASERPKPLGALPTLSLPYRGPSQQSRTVQRALRPADDAPSPELSHPTTHSEGGGPVDGRRVPAPPRATSGVWLPPSRRPPPPLPAREAPERPWASPFKASLARGGTPLGATALLTFLRRASPLREALRRPPSGPSSRRELGSDPRGPDTTSFLGFPPPESSPPPAGPSLVIARPALPPLGRVTSLPAWVSGPCDTEGSAGPFPDCRLSWGFAPSDRRGAPYAVSGSGLMVSPRGGRRLRDSLPL